MKFLYRDRDLVVVHKTSGTVVYSDGTDAKGKSCYDQVRKSLGPNAQLFPVHRLDKGTCGVLMFALNSKVAALLQRDFKADKIQKIYWALVFGKTRNSGEIREPLAPNKSKNKLPSLTKFVLKKAVDCAELAEIEKDEGGHFLSWVEVSPRTGRYHQIRRHFRGEGHPLLGDGEYGGQRREGWANGRLGINRLCLSAIEIRFTHPVNRKKMVVRTRPDPSFQRILNQLFQEAGDVSGKNVNTPRKK